MTSRKRPLDPNSNSRSKRSLSTSRSSGSGKSSRNSSSDSPSQTANNVAGFDIARHKLRSVLTHPTLGLPLLFAFHDKETENMKYLSQKRTQFTVNQEQIKTLDGLFQKAVEGTENKEDENELQALHEAGFVHGDIRAYNTVSKDANEGWLVDFDFGGKSGEQTYPKGYRRNLDDGIQMGTEDGVITK
ncbi:hypothetical protein IV203_014651 [Nitzschia inconspicua]|uniref:Protein kinase domain-containing protein n=1 Tax=Nitzschia inconspicua TaxID=303405 RepID=A0A9K3PUW9_9STRA|nr:hypothetical protein IV203_018984 [Nitzschia inconspicua]KAG7358064.1 hypothetical protein IV203_014651 [Nitzschia inconspicua]